MAALVLMTTGCSNEIENEVINNNEQTLVPVVVNVSGFSIEQEDFPGTRASQDVADYNGVKAITLAFFKSDGVEQYKSTQLRANEDTYTTFGNFSLSLPSGSYTMVVLGYGSEVPIKLNSKSSAEFDEEKSRETFAYSREVNISNAKDAVTLDATLNRIVTRLAILSTDNRPANVVAVRATLTKGGKAFNPITGLATTDTGLNNTSVISTAVGAKTSSVTHFFLTSNEESMDVTIETLDAENNVLFSKTLKNVPFQRNRVTALKGAMYSASASGAFKAETDWIEETHTVEF